tara:strand:- start:123 stop:1064 length:942 start_codon:yes stop_codon:yes gene_type:complete
MINKNSKILVAGCKGMVGSAVTRALHKNSFSNVIEVSREQVDFLNQNKVKDLLKTEKPDYMIIAAARVGGINANNSYRAQFIYENLTISSNLIHSAHIADVQNLIYLGSSCIYPKDCPQPIKEEYLLSGPLEFTNEPYAIAKIASLKLCENYNFQYSRNYITVMPTNLYGPNDNYDLNTSHVFPALIKKVVIAKKENYKNIEIWGSGKPLREFLHVDDLADAILFLMKSLKKPDILNIGSSEELSIEELAKKMIYLSGLDIDIKYNETMPDGVLRKRLDLSKINSLGWKSKISIDEGIKMTLREIEQNFKYEN